MSKASGYGCTIMKLSIVEENRVLRKWYKIRALSIPEQLNTISSLLHADISRRNFDPKGRHSFYNTTKNDKSKYVEEISYG